jgi:DNA-binding NtrC family response regulator
MSDASPRPACADDGSECAATILVVEDEVLIRMVLADYLEESGFRVLEAGTAAQAIAVLDQRDGPSIDLVFSDIRMPGPLNGFDLARWLAVHRPAIPVILTSGEAARDQAGGGLGRNLLFLAKPYDISLLATHIRSMLTDRTEGPRS